VRATPDVVYLAGERTAHLKERDGVIAGTIRTWCGKVALPGAPVESARHCHRCIEAERERRMSE
jgi:hypothetical protein